LRKQGFDYFSEFHRYFNLNLLKEMKEFRIARLCGCKDLMVCRTASDQFPEG
jgi:hypothetical protein